MSAFLILSSFWAANKYQEVKEYTLDDINLTSSSPLTHGSEKYPGVHLEKIVVDYDSERSGDKVIVEIHSDRSFFVWMTGYQHMIGDYYGEWNWKKNPNNGSRSFSTNRYDVVVRKFNDENDRIKDQMKDGECRFLNTIFNDFNTKFNEEHDKKLRHDEWEEKKNLEKEKLQSYTPQVDDIMNYIVGDLITEYEIVINSHDKVSVNMKCPDIDFIQQKLSGSGNSHRKYQTVTVEVETKHSGVVLNETFTGLISQINEHVLHRLKGIYPNLKKVELRVLDGEVRIIMRK